MYELMSEAVVFRTKNDFKRFRENDILYIAALHMMALTWVVQECNIRGIEYPKFIKARAPYWRYGFSAMRSGGGDLHNLMHAVDEGSGTITYSDGDSFALIVPDTKAPHVRRFFQELAQGRVQDATLRTLMMKMSDDMMVNDSPTNDAIRRIRNMRNLASYDSALVGNFIRLRMERLNVRTDMYRDLTAFIKANRKYDVNRYSPREEIEGVSDHYRNNHQSEPAITIDLNKPKKKGSLMADLAGLGAGYMMGRSFFK